MRFNVSRLLTLIQRASLIRRAGLAFALGALATTAMPPLHLWPVLWIALPLFLSLIDSARSWRQAVLIGWAFGFGYFATGFAWIGNAFFVDRETFAALAVPAIGGLAAGFALYMSVVAVVTRALAPSSAEDDMPPTGLVAAMCRVCLFAAVWVLVEWWRGWFLTGLPWNTIGSVWVTAPSVLQSASLLGVYGLSLITVMAASAAAVVQRAGASRAALTFCALCHVPLVTAAAWGAVRLADADTTYVPGITLRLVQPNIAQQDKWRPGLREAHVLEQVRMSTEDADTVTHVLWAETAVPFPLNMARGALAATAQAAPENGYVLTGAARIIEQQTGRQTDRQAFNSLFAVSPEGSIAAVYDKAHLVPFGEYIPFRDILPLPQLTGGSGFTAGPGPVTIDLPGLPGFSPLICYEVIFSRAVTDDAARPAWLFNLTNDAWFGDSSGPYQHLAAAQLRAAEEGLPVVRVANTGISAVINGYGQITGRIPLEQKGILDSALPAALPMTFFARFGQWPVLALSLGLAFGAAVLGRKNAKYS